MFQTKDDSNEFDSTENEFCFSHYQNDKEFWFEISLGDIKKITNKSITNINIKLADT
ncbi:hypothetical protein N8768_05045 [Flavobacteriaceae bacterium]|jgi:hypothetical protein|nr:hypothetical protein [Flavobacteriaceae bacterium]